MKKWHFDLDQTGRLQIKLFVCLLGVLLLFVLLSGGFLKLLLSREEEVPREEPIHTPVVQTFFNVWILDANQERLLIFREGKEESYPFPMFPGEVETDEKVLLDLFPDRMNFREQIADVEITDGLATGVKIKKEKIHARLLGAEEKSLELEGYGEIDLAEDVKGYRIHDALTMCTQYDLPFGYDFADYVLENGKICGILWAKEEAMEYIRVLIKAGDYGGIFHKELIFSADCDVRITYGSYDNLQTEEVPAETLISLHQDSPYFTGERIWVTPSLLTGRISLQNVNRSQGVPAYRGRLELLRTQEGIVLLNEVLLEEYLYSVVPSEMPSTYPEEALKAQAICARTYAYGHMLQAGYPQYGAHVDDSTSYQVYNNILEQPSTTTATKDTYGQLLYTKEGELAGTYYYSTSCGVGSDANVWKTEAAKGIDYLRAGRINLREMEQTLQRATDGNSGEGDGAANFLQEESDPEELFQEEDIFAEFISSVHPEDFEVQEQWYRWHYSVKEIDRKEMLAMLQKRYQANPNLVLTLREKEYVSEPIEELSQIKEIRIEGRGTGGVAEELIIKTKKHTYKVISEYNIRSILKNSESPVIRQDGSEVTTLNLLPSAFFVLESVSERNNVSGYVLKGGGFGHGAGMSQNAAKNMALGGFDALQILLFFYENCTVRNVYAPEASKLS